ncbi:MAG: hypothetical protein IIB15_08935 [Chloroflexi bacterium]|nr:hypothetical protein [Chloroflexota bacterium]
MKDARRIPPRHSKLFTILLAVAMLTGFALVACKSATSSEEPRVGGETAGLGQAAAAPATPKPDASKPQPTQESGTPMVSDTPSGAAISLVGKPGRDVGDLAHSFTLPSVSGSPFSLDTQRGDKNVVVVFYRAFW